MGLWDSITSKVSDVVNKYTSRQPSGKQPDPVASTNTTTSQSSSKQPVSSNPLGIIDVRQSLDTWTKSPAGVAAAADVKTLSVSRQPSGKQPEPTPTASNPLGIIDVRQNLDDYLKSPEGIAATEEAKRLFSGSSGKQPDTSALIAFDQDTLRRLQEEADRKRLEEQLAAAATHGKEYVFEFSKPLTSKANTYISRLVKLLGGKRSYIEDQTKLVVVM